MNNILDALNWRYATKTFDATKKVSQADLDQIIEAFRLTPSSFGLQPWKLVLVENMELRGKLVEYSYWQKQVQDASHLLVLTRKLNFWNADIDVYLDDIVTKRNTTREYLLGYEWMMKWAIEGMGDDVKVWQEKQLYIALWNLMTVCAILWIDSCPMEGFMADQYDEILQLKEKWLSSVLVLPIWYRSKEDIYANLAKIRFEKQDILERI